MKKNAATRVLIWTFVAFVLVAALVLGIGGSRMTSSAADRRYEDGDSYTAGDTAFAARDVREIELHWVSGSVEITVYDGDEIRISETASRALNEDEQLHYRLRNGKLTVQYSASSLHNWLFSIAFSKTLQVQIPRDLALDGFSLENVSSSVNIQGEGLRVRKVDVETVSGEVYIEGISGDFLELEGVSGSLFVKGGFEQIKADTVSGEQTFFLTETPGQLRSDAVSGGITVHLAGERGFTARMDSISGTITSDLVDTLDNKTVIYGDGSASLRFDTVSGNVRIVHDGTLSAPVEAEAATPMPTPTVKPTGGPPIPSGQRSF